MFNESLSGAAAFAAQIFPAIFTYDLLRYAIGAGSVFIIVNIMLARRLGARKIRAETAGRAQIFREVAASMRTVLIFSLVGLFIATGAELGLFEIYLDPSERGWAYFAANVLFLIVAHDAWFYWTHRLLHRFRPLRRWHMLHHRSFNPTPWTSYSFDAIDALINALYFPIAMFLMPSSVLAAVIFTWHMMIRNAIGHCGYEIFPARRDGRPLLDFLTAVTHHDLHHGAAGWNFGLYFTFWDRLMGTEHPDYLAEFKRTSRRRRQLTV